MPRPGVPATRLPWQAAFVVLAGIWGCSFLFIKLGLDGLNPIQVAFARVAIGAITLVILADAQPDATAPRAASTWRHLFVMAALMNVVPFILFSYGETHVSSILAGIINGATPLDHPGRGPRSPSPRRSRRAAGSPACSSASPACWSWSGSGTGWAAAS